jgi:hypothetical protein
VRDIDWKLSIAVRDRWQGKEAGDIALCPLLADLDYLLTYLDEIGLEPGHAIAKCTHCGEEHRWVLIKELMHHALTMRSPDHSRLLDKVDKSLNKVRDLYGGKEKYEEMRRAGEAYFSKLKPGHRYMP